MPEAHGLRHQPSDDRPYADGEHRERPPRTDNEDHRCPDQGEEALAQLQPSDSIQPRIEPWRDVLHHAFHLGVIESSAQLHRRLSRLLLCERSGLSEHAIQIGKGVRCPASGLASVLVPRNFLRYFWVCFFAADHTSDSSLQWLWRLPLNAPDTRKIFDQIGHRVHQKLPSILPVKGKALICAMVLNCQRF
jgi:hypothetical protein